MRTLLIVATLLYVLSLVPAAFMLLMSPMAFDAGESPEAWALVFGLLSYPVWVLVTLAAAWILYGKGRRRWALAALLLPIPGVLLAALLGAVTHGGV